MKKLLLFLLLFGLHPVCYSQSFEWEYLLSDTDRQSDGSSCYIEKIVTSGEHIYIGFQSYVGGYCFPDSGGYEYGKYERQFIAKFDMQGNFIWSRGLSIAEGFDFDVQNGNLYLSAFMTGDITIGSQKIMRTGTRQVILLALNEQGNLLWYKRSPHFYSSMYPVAVAVNKNHIVVGFQNNRRDLIRFDSDETIPQKSLYTNIIQLYDTLGNFQSYKAFNSHWHDDKLNDISQIEKHGESFIIKMGRPDGRGFYNNNYETTTYNQVKIYNPDNNTLINKLNFAAQSSFDIKEMKAVLDNRYLIAGYTHTPSIEIEQRFQLDYELDKTKANFIALIDHVGGPIWSIPLKRNSRVTDLSYDADKQEFYASIVKYSTRAEREETGKPAKNIIYKISRFGKKIDSSIIFLYADDIDIIARAPIISSYQSKLYYCNVLYGYTSTTTPGPLFNVAKIHFEVKPPAPLPTKTLYPNPAITHLILKGITNKETNVKVYALNGQAAENYRFEIKDNIMVIYIDQIPNGIYFLKIEDEQNSKTYKFLKQ